MQNGVAENGFSQITVSYSTPNFSMEELSFHQNPCQEDDSNQLVLSYDHQSNWDTSVQEMQDKSFSHHHQHQEQHLQHVEIQNGHNQIFNSSSLPDIPYPPTPDILNLFHLSRCSSSSFQPNSSFSIPNQTQKSANLAASLGFLGSVSNVFYDALLHLNLPPPPTLFRELHDPLPHGFNLPGTRAGNLFAGVDEREASGVYQDGDGRHFDNGVLEISRDIKLAQKRDGKKTKKFTTERHRREHLNEKFKVLRSLVPNPTKNNRVSIVGDAIAYIKELLRTVDEAEILVVKTRSSRDQRNKRHKTEGDAAGDQIKNSKMMQPLGDPNELTRSWLQRKSKDTDVDVRIVDNEVTVKLVQRKKINCLLFVISKALDELQLDLYHVAVILAITTVFCSTPRMIRDGSCLYASAMANKLVEVVDREHSAIPPTNGY